MLLSDPSLQTCAHPHTSLVEVGNYGSAWQVTWANPRLGKVTLNRARLHLSPEYRSAPLPAMGSKSVVLQDYTL